MTQALTITARNAMALTGMSWKRVLTFARANDVPVYRLTERTTAVNAAAFVAALEHAQAAVRTTSPRKLDALDLLLLRD